jgi:hypothetical protein
MPRGPSSVASDFVSAFTPALLAAYAEYPASPRWLARDETLTIAPPAPPCIANIRQSSATPKRFVSRTVVRSQAPVG